MGQPATTTYLIAVGDFLARWAVEKSTATDLLGFI